MKLRSRTINSPSDANHMRWAALPAEIRLTILEQAEIGNIQAHDLSNWARVSREWQTFFEPQIFQHLKLQFPGSDIDDLNSSVHSYRRHLVKKISLHVRTEEYDCVDEFDRPETRDTIKANNKLFSQALKKLFVSLSTWSSGSPTGGIKLSLSAGSPSDSGHPLKPYTGTERSQYDRMRIWSLSSRQRLLGNLLDASSGTLKLPQVSVVNRFSVNQYRYRSLSRALLAKVLHSLPRLKSIRYEPWHAITRDEQFPRDEAMIIMLECASELAMIKSVHIWEAQSSLHENPRFLRFCNDYLVSTAVNASYRLRYFSLCHAVDARDFFQHASRDVPANSSESSDGLRTWPILKYLALTTHIGDLVSSPSALERLLLQASRAAVRMPLLRVMEIWAPGAGKGIIFRYHVRKGSPLLTVIATWQLALSKEALISWKQVAASYTKRELTCDVKLVGSGTTMSDSPYALYHLLELGPQLRE
ncbi:hypothetical protein CGCSCA4_v011223 [Colletotrichum siamense]|uniref:DUF6546 domain-containing protein n=1 Tax=Colletotrichum siamense TaxID=690259 RepID=A0A9P5ELS0_COLSI|nr:hypothetical protein CGCSCA4_v011223 [Colletotrichum siamense]KAF4853254.1 hypothetical protein CGCSCA2_v010010 [Colletotrichum siamense]